MIPIKDKYIYGMFRKYFKNFLKKKTNFSPDDDLSLDKDDPKPNDYKNR